MKLAVKFTHETEIIVDEEYISAMTEILANSTVVISKYNYENNLYQRTETKEASHVPDICLVHKEDIVYADSAEPTEEKTPDFPEEVL